MDRPPAEPTRLAITHLAPGHYAFGHLGNVAMQVWFDQADERSALDLLDAGDRLFARYPQGISGIHWLKGGAQLPTPEARKHFVTMMQKHGHLIGEAAVILEGDGFWASGVRAMFTGLRIAAGGRAGFRISRTVPEALEWLPRLHFERTGVHVHAPELIEAIGELLARANEALDLRDCS